MYVNLKFLIKYDLTCSTTTHAGICSRLYALTRKNAHDPLLREKKKKQVIEQYVWYNSFCIYKHDYINKNIGKIFKCNSSHLWEVKLLEGGRDLLCFFFNISNLNYPCLMIWSISTKSISKNEWEVRKVRKRGNQPEDI